MTKQDAAQILYGAVPAFPQHQDLIQMMEAIQGKWDTPGSTNTWQNDTYHGIWWALCAIVHGNPQSVECAMVYLTLVQKARLERRM